MESKLYVGNLSFNATDEELKELFGQFGNVVSASVITDQYTGRSRGFAFVEMDSKEGADAAINALNGKEYKTRELVVNIARPKTAGGGGGSKGGPRDSRGGGDRGFGDKRPRNRF